MIKFQTTYKDVPFKTETEVQNQMVSGKVYNFLFTK